MDRIWWCADCRAPMELDKHGRCSTCGSDAVDSMLRPNAHGKPKDIRVLDLSGLPQYAGAL